MLPTSVRSEESAARPPDPEGYRRLLAFRLTPRAAFLAVWITWALLVGAHLALVATMTDNVPLGDEWFTLASMLGVERFDLGFLWRRHNEHRIPLPKLVMYLCYHVGNFDFRTAPYFYVLVLGAVSAGAIVIARAVRGRQSLTDAMFPLLLLNWGHSENTLWGFQAQMIASSAISMALLFCIVRRRTPLGVKGAAAASLTVCLIALCGQNGVGLVPPLSLWIAWSGLERWRRHDRHAIAGAAAIALSAAAPLLLVALVMRGLPLPERTSLLPDLKVAREFLMNGLGRAAENHHWLAMAFIVSLVTATSILMIATWRRHASERFRIVGLACFCLSVLSLALAMGYGRASGFQPRYAILAVPLYCAIFFVWELHGHVRWARSVPAALLIASIVCLPDSMRLGRIFAEDRRSWYTGPFVAAIAAGKPMPLIIGDHSAIAWHWQHILEYLLPELHERRIGVFKKLVDPPEYDSLAIPWAGATANNAVIDGDVITIGKGSSITISLQDPRYIEALRFVAEVDPLSPAVIRFRMAWRDSRRQPFDDARSSWQLLDLSAHGTPELRRNIHRHEFWCTVGAVVDEVMISLDGEPEKVRVRSLDAMTRR
jgi:hypothetical protein